MPPIHHPHTTGYRIAKAVNQLLLGLKRIFQIITIFLRYLWLLFPAFLFLMAAYFSLWSLLQGKDLLISSLETNWRGSILLIAVLFWVFTTWYSSRILVYKKDDLFYCGKKYFATEIPKKGFTLNWIIYKCSEVIGLNLPRMMGYICFAIIILAYMQLPVYKHPLHQSTAGWLLLGYIVLYIFLAKLFDRLGVIIVRKGGIRLLKKIFWAALAVYILFLLILLFFPFDAGNYTGNAVTVIIFLSIIQHLYLLVVVNRCHLIDNTKPSQKPADFTESSTSWAEKNIRRILRFVNVPYAEKTFFFVFNIISLIAIILYLTGVFNMYFATAVSSLNFAILAFGILVGYFELVSIISIHTRINFHVIILILVIIFGYFRETHYVRLLKKQSANLQKARPTLDAYFVNWAQQHRDSIENSNEYPVYFILADGGASRSGYWVTSVLGRLHDATNGAFDRHLFALSGASGGSVGNGAYFSLLYHKNQLRNKNFEHLGQDFLKHDFLSYTLARMLGPDFFRPLLPFDPRNMYDRAGALENVMEYGTGDTTFLNGKFAIPFSYLVPDTSYIQLPILCINTTRMQDGRPGVVSNIEIDTATFGKRIDVLSLLPGDTDMRLSTAVVLGARFPYISPAGRIDHRTDSGTTTSYFVDGGYFDNSGAGVVHEMILRIQKIMETQLKDSTDFNYLNKLSFYVIHITNSPEGSPKLEKVHLLRNDLMAPISTLAGSFGTQTDVNNLRLERYLQLIYPATKHYIKAELYYNIDRDTLSFPMNWTISHFYQTKMNRQLNNPQIKALVDTVRQKIGE